MSRVVDDLPQLRHYAQLCVQPVFGRVWSEDKSADERCRLL
jgi:hypothetical protein